MSQAMNILIDRKSTRLNSSHSLHDALPISDTFGTTQFLNDAPGWVANWTGQRIDSKDPYVAGDEYINRSEEHTSELQSLPPRRSSDLRYVWHHAVSQRRARMGS